MRGKINKTVLLLLLLSFSWSLAAGERVLVDSGYGHSCGTGE